MHAHYLAAVEKENKKDRRQGNNIKGREREGKWKEEQN